jgi:hypothetical protein
MGPGKLDDDQTAQGNTGFTQVWPPLYGKDLRPACLTLLMGWLQWLCYSGGVD